MNMSLRDTPPENLSGTAGRKIHSDAQESVGDPADWFSAGIGCSNRGDHFQALEYFEAALREKTGSSQGAAAGLPSESVLCNARGNVLFLLDLNQGALDAYSRAIRLDPAYVLPHMGRGHIFRYLDMLPEALKSYEAAIALDQMNALAHYGRGHVLRDLKQLPAALEAYETAFMLNPDAPPTYYGKATLTFE
jgi:tetratricopeptide (TPR) repeat protein